MQFEHEYEKCKEQGIEIFDFMIDEPKELTDDLVPEVICRDEVEEDPEEE